MPELNELKKKWFINTTDTRTFPPQIRHPGSFVGDHSSEIHLAVVDSENDFTKDLRLALWQEHMELDVPDSLNDPREAVGHFREEAASGNGRLVLYPTKRFKYEFPYRWIMNRLIDPYSGPKRV